MPGHPGVARSTDSGGSDVPVPWEGLGAVGTLQFGPLTHVGSPLVGSQRGCSLGLDLCSGLRGVGVPLLPLSAPTAARCKLLAPRRLPCPPLQLTGCPPLPPGRPLGDICPAARQPGADGLWEEGTAAAELQDPGEPGESGLPDSVSPSLGPHPMATWHLCLPQTPLPAPSLCHAAVCAGEGWR